jgi:Carboxypeptidase regulatory-like domain
MKRVFALFVTAIVASACGNGGPLAPTAAGPLAADAFTVSGAVVEADGGQPIAGAEVAVSSGIDSHSAVSASGGAYSVRGLRAGRWSVMVSKLGYDPQSISVDVTKDMTLSFELSRSAPDPNPRPRGSPMPY